MNNQSDSLVRSGKNIEMLNILALSIGSLLEGIQILIVTIFVCRFIPTVFHVTGIMSDWIEPILPEREMLFYGIFVGLVLSLYGLGMYIFRKKLTEESFFQNLRRFLWIESFVVGLALFVLYQTAILKISSLPNYLFVVWCVLAVTAKMFWKPIADAGNRLYRYLGSQYLRFKPIVILDVMVVLFIFLTLFIADRDGALALTLINDQFYHFDGFVMAPAWAYTKGLLLNVDVASPYGIGLPMLVGSLAQWLGGFNYANVLTVLTLMGIFYVAIAYGLLRLWLGSILVAFIGTLWIIKMQIFHMGSDRFPWLLPTNSVIRYFWSVVVLFLIFLHCRTKQWRYVVVAALVCGVGIFYIFDTGIYQLFTYWTYLLVILLVPLAHRQFFKMRGDGYIYLFCLFLPFVSAFMLFYITVGDHIFMPNFWQGQVELSELFLSGVGLFPMTHVLYKGIPHFVVGYVIPPVYLFTIICLGTLWYRGKIEYENIFVMVVSFYGLCIYHSFLGRSDYYHLFDVTVTFVMVMCYGLKTGVEFLKTDSRKIILTGVLLISLWALWTTSGFIKYPGVMNMAYFMDSSAFEQREIIQNKKFFAKDDVALIQELTAEEEEVCLISSFEVALLVEADRKPFFYQFPLIYSSVWETAQFSGTYLSTKNRLAKAMGQLDNEKPSHVFVEKRFYFGSLPMKYYVQYKSLAMLMEYLKVRYTVIREGKHLVALRRKDV